MQIVIDIDDDFYNKFMYGDDVTDDDFNKFVDIIASGTSLPKGHGRLIDADKILKGIEGMEDNLCDEKDKQSVRYLRIEMKFAPTVLEADKESVE